MLRQLGGARSLKAVLSRSNPTREALAEVELAAKVAVCQSAAANAKKNFFEHESRGRKPQERVFDCWRFATAANSIQQVKIFGERRSGSRFIKQLVSLNIDASLLSLEGETKGKLPPVVDELYKRDFSRSLGWRHACAPSPAQLDAAGVSFEMLHRTLFVLVAKNPCEYERQMYELCVYCLQTLPRGGSCNAFLNMSFLALASCCTET